MTEWCKGWQQNGWRTRNGGPVVNRCQIEEILEASQDMDIFCVSANSVNLSTIVKFIVILQNWVPSHSGIEENVEADRLANAAARDF